MEGEISRTKVKSGATRIIKVDPIAPEPEKAEEAAGVIRRGGVVAFPTETVYGLGANGFDPEAVRRVFRIKGRDPRKPLIVLVPDLEKLRLVAEEVPPIARGLIASFWPGALTLIFWASFRLPQELLGAGRSVGVRVPDNAVALALLRKTGVPITAPSANLSGSRDPVSSGEVYDQLKGKIDLILDGGAMKDRTPSTVLDLSGQVPTVLRVGRVPIEQIREVIPTVKVGTGLNLAMPPNPGRDERLCWVSGGRRPSG